MGSVPSTTSYNSRNRPYITNAPDFSIPENDSSGGYRNFSGGSYVADFNSALNNSYYRNDPIWSYSLDGGKTYATRTNTGNGRFGMIWGDGRLYYTGQFNAEEKSQYDMRVRVLHRHINNESNYHYAYEDVRITISDKDEHSPTVWGNATNSGYNRTLENTKNVVFDFTASDYDISGPQGPYSWKLTDNLDSNLFRLNKTSDGAQVELISELDYETKTSYSFQIEVSDGAKSTTRTIYVPVDNVIDETPPTFDLISNGAVNDISNDELPSFIGTANPGSKVKLFVGQDQWNDDDHSDLVYQIEDADGFVDLPDRQLGGALTAEAWVKLDAYNNWSRIIDFGDGSRGDNIVLSLFGNTGRLCFETWNGSNKKFHITTDEKAPLNRWFHIAAVLGEDKVGKIYVDGELKKAGTASQLPANKIRNNNWVAKSNWSHDSPLAGSIRDLHVFDDARTAQEIQSDMSVFNSIGTTEADQNGNWRIDASSTGTVFSDGIYSITAQQTNYTSPTNPADPLIKTISDKSTAKLIKIDTTNPTITSSSTAKVIDENIATSTVIYTATADDLSPITWSLKGEHQASMFDIDADGNVSLVSSPDYEVNGGSLKFTVNASDGNLSTDQTVTLGIKNVFESFEVTEVENAADVNVKDNKYLKLQNYNQNTFESKNLFNVETLMGKGRDDWNWGVRIPQTLSSLFSFNKNSKFLSFNNDIHGAHLTGADNRRKRGLHRFIARPDSDSDVLTASEKENNRRSIRFFVDDPDLRTATTQSAKRERAFNILNGGINKEGKKFNFKDVFKSTNRLKVDSDGDGKKDTWQISNNPTDEDQQEAIKILNKFDIKQGKEEDFLNKLDQGSAVIASNFKENEKDLKEVIIDTSSTNDSLIVDAEIKSINEVLSGKKVTRQNQIIKLLQAEGLKVDDNATIDAPINELDFSVDTLANGTAIVRLELSDDENNVNRVIKTNSKDESFIYNSEIKTYTGSWDTDTAQEDFDDWLNSLDYKLYYYDIPDSSDGKHFKERGLFDPNTGALIDSSGDFITVRSQDNPNTVVNEASLSQAFDRAEINKGGNIAYVDERDHLEFVDGSSILIDKDNDKKVDLISSYLLDQGFFDIDRSVGLIRDPIILITSPIPDVPIVSGSSVVIDNTPTFSGTTDKAGNIITIYQADGVTPLATTTSSEENGVFKWAIDDGSYGGNVIAEGQQILKVTASDANGESISHNFNITVDTIDPEFTSAGIASVNENEGDLQVYSAVATDGGTGIDSYALKAVDDYQLFNFNTVTGDVSLKDSANYEDKDTYNFTVIANDIAGNQKEQAVTLNVINVNEGSSTFVISGIAKVGETISVSEAVVDTDQRSGALSYQWQLSSDDGNTWDNIAGATDISYKIAAGDENKKLQSLVSYTDDGGFDHTNLATNALNTVSLAKVAVNTDQALIEYQYKFQRSGSNDNLTGVLGYSKDTNTRLDYANATYDLIVEGRTKTNGDINGKDVTWDLETFDLTLDFNDLFSNWDSVGVIFGSEINQATSSSETVDLTEGVDDTLRVTGATSTHVDGDVSDTGISNTYKELFTLTGLKLDAAVAKGLGTDGNTTNDFINLDIKTNIYDTVVANYQDTNADTSKDNAYIASLADLNYMTGNDGGSVDDNSAYKTYIHEAYADLDEQGTTLYTQRSIGSKDKTFLIRDGSTVDAKAWWANRGSYGTEAKDLYLEAVTTTNFELMTWDTISKKYKTAGDQAYKISEIDTVVDASDVIEGSTVDGSNGTDTSWSGSTNESIEFEFKVKVDGTVGDRVNQLAKDFYKLAGEDTSAHESVSSKLTNNVITYQGDLNFDGRVSMKDLAFLNAGKLNASAKVGDNKDVAADDVDANFDGQISASDLAIIDRDWGGTIHQKGQSYLGDAVDVASNTGEWEIKEWQTLSAIDGTTIGSVGTVDFNNAAFASQQLVDASQPNPLAGDLFDNTDPENLYSGGSTYDQNKF